MNKQLFPHHPKCTPNYPEKPKNGKPQHIMREDLGYGDILYQCVDCGAYILVREKIDSVKSNDQLVARVRQAIKESKK